MSICLKSSTTYTDTASTVVWKWNFLNSAKEIVVDSTEDLTKQIVIQYDIASDKKSDEKILPWVPIQQAFTALQSLKLFEK